jgi:hypothetical protein
LKNETSEQIEVRLTYVRMGYPVIRVTANRNVREYLDLRERRVIER